MHYFSPKLLCYINFNSCVSIFVNCASHGLVVIQLPSYGHGNFMSWFHPLIAGGDEEGEFGKKKL